jgi:3-phenylpropionate/trans-cinnamate dioxygenase ferredoxin reductase component
MHVAILGNGITGTTVARHLRKRDPDVRITMISGESTYHYSRPALMYVYMGHLRYQDIKPYEDHFWADNRIDLKRGWVTRVDTAARTLHFQEGDTLAYDALVLATGSQPNRFGWPGQDLDRVHGLYSLQHLVSLERLTPQLEHAVIVGGGLIGIELAEMLHTRHIPVTMLVREKNYWDNVLPHEEAAMVSRAIHAEGIDLRLMTELTEIHDDGKGGAGGVTTSKGDRIPCQFVGLTAGVRPNLKAVEGSDIETARGVLVDWQLRTSVDGVYAAGDCAELRTPEGERNVIQQVWYTGRFQGEVCAENVLGGNTDYEKRTWFNSAKFLDIEYQVYGDVPNLPHDGKHNLYWEHESGRKSVRIVHDGDTVLGFNVMGIRYRHEVCERWIETGASICEVLPQLGQANFDPEFHARHEAEICTALFEQLEATR